MNPDACYLIWLTDGEQVLEVALKAARPVEYPMEPEGKAELLAQLPAHCRSFGQIVSVREIFDVQVTESKELPSEPPPEPAETEPGYSRQNIELRRMRDGALTAARCPVCVYQSWSVRTTPEGSYSTCTQCGLELHFGTR